VSIMRLSPIGLFCWTAFVLFCSLFMTSVASAAAVPLNAASAKQMLQARKVGKMVKIKEADGTVLRAKLVSIGEVSVIVQVGSKPTVEVPYDKVTAVKGPGLPKEANIAIVVVAVVWIALLYPAFHTSRRASPLSRPGGDLSSRH
jgi:hypothetical protein